MDREEWEPGCECGDALAAQPATSIESDDEAWPVTGADYEWHDILHGRFYQDKVCYWVPKAVKTQFKVYRQRAWIFFDNGRFYPKPVAKHLPSCRDVQLMEKEALASFIAPGQTRRLRRSRAWHEKTATNNEVLWGTPTLEDDGDEEGQVGMHPTEFLQHWLRPFWE